MIKKIVPLIVSAAMMATMLFAIPAAADGTPDWQLGGDDFSSLTTVAATSLQAADYATKLKGLEDIGWTRNGANDKGGDATISTEPGSFTLTKTKANGSDSIWKTFWQTPPAADEDCDLVFDMELSYKNTATATSNNYIGIQFRPVGTYKWPIELRLTKGGITFNGGTGSDATGNANAGSTSYTMGKTARVTVYIRKIGSDVRYCDYKAYAVVTPDVTNPSSNKMVTVPFRLHDDTMVGKKGTWYGVPTSVNIYTPPSVGIGDYVKVSGVNMYYALHAPMATNVTVANKAGGTATTIGDTLKVSYTYEQTENAAEEDTKITWYRADDSDKTNPVQLKTGTYTPGGTDSALEYEVSAQDGDKYIYATVEAGRESWDSDPDRTVEKKLITNTFDPADPSIDFIGAGADATPVFVSAKPAVSITSFERVLPAPAAAIDESTVVTDGYQLKVGYTNGSTTVPADSLIEWFQEGNATPVQSMAMNAAGSDTYTVKQSDVGQKLYAKITPKKGAEIGTASETDKTAAVTQNVKPEPKNLTLANSSTGALLGEVVPVNTPLKMTYTFHDENGDLEKVSGASFTWQTAPAKTGPWTTVSTSATYTPTELVWLKCQVKVEAQTGVQYSDVIDSAPSHIISGEAPTVTVSGLEMVNPSEGTSVGSATNLTDGYTIKVQYTLQHADQAEVKWYQENNDTPVAAGSDSYEIKTADIGKKLYATVTPYITADDVTGAATPSDLTPEITANAKPVATELMFTTDGTPATAVTQLDAGDEIKPVFTYSDAENDPAGTHEYQWFEAGYQDGAFTAIAGQTASTFKPGPEHVGKWVKFGVTPVASAGVRKGEQVLSGAAEVVADLTKKPVANGVSLSGTAKVGQTLSVTYGYEDPNGFGDDSVIEWFLSSNGSAYDTVPVYRHEASYTIPSGLEGQYIRVTITPKNKAGVEGTPVDSNVLGPIQAKSTSSGGGSGSGGSNSNKSTTVRIPVTANPTPAPTPGGTPSPSEGSKYYKDVDANYAWAKDAIDNLTQLGVFSGSDDGAFQPDKSITREEIAKTVVEAFGINGTKAELNYNDLDKDSWSYSYLSLAVGSGIMQGFDETSFGADQPISRQDFAVVIKRAMDAKGIQLQPKREAPEFTDADQISGYAADAVSQLYRAGIVSGKDGGAFDPAAQCTRAEAAKMLAAVLELE